MCCEAAAPHEAAALLEAAAPRAGRLQPCVAQARPSGGSAALLEAAIELALRLHVEAADGGLAAEGRALAVNDGSSSGGGGTLAIGAGDGNGCGGGGGGNSGGDGGGCGDGGAEGDILMFLTGQEEIETASQAVRALAEELSAEMPHLPRLEVRPRHTCTRMRHGRWMPPHPL